MVVVYIADFVDAVLVLIVLGLKDFIMFHVLVD